MAIIVATDFTPEAEEACRVGAALAGALGDSLSFVHVLEAATTFPLASTNGERNPEVARLHAARALLDKVVAKVAAPNQEIGTEVTTGFVEDALVAHARAKRASLLLIGSSGRDGHSSFRDLAEKLAEVMPCPVLAVRPNSERLGSALAGQRILRVFVALDRTLASDAPIEWVRRLRERISCDVLVHHFYVPEVEHRRLGIPMSEEPFKADPQVVRALERELRSRLEGLVGEGALTVDCEPHFGSVAVEALCSARAEGADLIVVGAHHRHGLARFVHGSVSRDIIRHSEVPVLCVGSTFATHERKHKIHKVLVATDLTDVGNRAIAYAYDLLGAGGGTVDIVHVAPQEATPARKAQLSEKLQHCVPHDVDSLAVSTRCYILDGASIPNAILQAAARWNVDAICVASAGRGSLDHALSGSIAIDVAQEAQCPVLVVRDIAA